ncbi:MAG: hypothetical protein ACOCXP_00510 [Candidatus Dojkabacteria bacterium]
MSQNLAHNSFAEIYTDQKGRKVIRKRSKLSLPRKEVEKVADMIRYQRESFAKMKVPTSDLLSLEVVGGEEQAQIQIIELFAGADFSDIVDNDNYPMYLDRLLDDIFAPLLLAKSNAGEDGWLDIGIDGIPRNFVYSIRENQFLYVDFFPPKVRWNGRHIQEIPETPSEEFFKIRMMAHNSAPGIIYNLYINLIRDFPDQLPLTVGKLEQFCREIGREDAFSSIADSPLYREDEATAIKEIIDTLGDWHGQNFYLLREAANWLGFHSKSFPEKKKKAVFDLTKQGRDPKGEDYGIISKEKFVQVKQILLDELNARSNRRHSSKF